MSSTNITEGENKIDAESEEQPSQQSPTEQQPASSDIRSNFNVKVTGSSKDSEEPPFRSSSLSSLDELAARLKTQFNKDDIDRAVSITIDSENPVPLNNLKKSENSKSLNDILERLHHLKSKDDLSSGIKTHTSVNMAIASGSTWTASNSVNSVENVLHKNKELDDKESFVTVDACQKEKMTSTDVPTIFSIDDRTQNIIVGRNDYTNRPPPPYDYSQRPQRYEYQGMAGQTPVYQTQNVEYGMGMTQDASQAPPYRRHDPMMENLFNTKQIRNQFIRKVYMILAAQLLFSFGLITFCIYEENAREFVTKQWILMIAAMVAFIFLMITLFCYTSVRRTYPLNFILLSLMTLSMAYMTAAVSCYYDTKIVMISMGATGAICTLLSILACQHWFDITECGMILCIASIIILIYGIIAIIITMITGSNIAYLIYACLVTLLFCVYLMYDTQQILGGRRIELSPEEYILGAITLYVDIMIIFQHILVLASHCR